MWWGKHGATTRAILAMSREYTNPLGKSIIKYGVPRIPHLYPGILPEIWTAG